MRGSSARGIDDEKKALKTTCTVPDCAREFSFVAGDTQIFESLAHLECLDTCHDPIWCGIR